MSKPQSVYIVDDDRDVRVSLGLSLGTLGIDTRPFSSAEDFLDELAHLQPGCVLLDLLMPGTSGLDVLRELARREIRWPVIVLTGHAQVALAVEAMKRGAIEFLEKPVDENALQEALERGFGLIASSTTADEARGAAAERVARLTGRELDVLGGMAAGLANKEIAIRLQLSHRTVEMHRASLMKKLGAGSLAEALGLASQAGVTPASLSPEA